MLSEGVNRVQPLGVTILLKGAYKPWTQEDANGEKLTVKKWWIFGADFFTVWCRFFTVYADFSRFIRDINGEKKNLVIDDRFFTVSFSRFAPSRWTAHRELKRWSVEAIYTVSIRWCLENWQGRVFRQGSQDTVYPLREMSPQRVFGVAVFAFRPICCLLFLVETPHFAFLGGKRRRIWGQQNMHFWHVLESIFLGRFWL